MRCLYAVHVLFGHHRYSDAYLYKIGGSPVMFFDWYILLWECFFDSLLTEWFYLPVLCLGFIACLPGMFKRCIYGR